MRQARTSILLSTLFVALGGTAARCSRSPLPHPSGTALENYDRAVALYFRAPRNPEKAIALLAGACTHIREQQAQSCYNWGLLLEMEKDRSGALSAYRRAAALQPLDVYQAAAAALDESARPEGHRLGALQKALAHCREKNPERALAVMREAAAEKAGGWTRELVGQPVLRECLGRVRGYQDFVAALPPTGAPLEERHRAAMAARDSFHRIWDIEARLAGRETTSGHPVTTAWRQALRHAARGDGASTGRYLQQFLHALPKSGADAPRARGMAKAAALVVQQTRFFAAVRAHPEVQRFVAAAL